MLVRTVLNSIPGFLLAALRPLPRGLPLGADGGCSSGATLPPAAGDHPQCPINLSDLMPPTFPSSAPPPSSHPPQPLAAPFA